jgi:hypothetical protein
MPGVVETTDTLGAMVVAVLDDQDVGLCIPQHPSPSSMVYARNLKVVYLTTWQMKKCLRKMKGMLKVD